MGNLIFGNYLHSSATGKGMSQLCIFGICVYLQSRLRCFPL